jgi:hypothetical protein
LKLNEKKLKRNFAKTFLIQSGASAIMIQMLFANALAKTGNVQNTKTVSSLKCENHNFATGTIKVAIFFAQRCEISPKYIADHTINSWTEDVCVFVCTKGS